MGTEIERKFLVKNDEWRPAAEGMDCRQGYLATGPPVSVRVRLMNGRGTLTIKNASSTVARDEFEYAIPPEDAKFLLERLCAGRVVEKTRHRIVHGGLTWEVDEFRGANAGLVIAEVELERETQSFERPRWLGREVSGDPRYLNSSLSKSPFSAWA